MKKIIHFIQNLYCDTYYFQLFKNSVRISYNRIFIKFSSILKFPNSFVN